MHAAPAVSVWCGGAGAWRACRAALPALAATALGAWALEHLQWAVWPALGLAPAVAALAWGWARPQPLHLAWDGQQWHADGRAGQLDLMMDLGPWMLLRLLPHDAPRRSLWIALDASDAGVNHHALRAAVYCRPPEPTRRAQVAQAGNAAKPD